jgi:MarR family transcriptional regulator, organic hydroperoxide resistance regulator
MMVHLGMIVDVTRTTTATEPLEAPPDDPMGIIIADFRATMTQLKCASSERLLRLGVSMAQLNIMYTVQRNGEMTMSHLADVLNVSLSNASGLIDRMEERGFVDRTRVPEDRRVVLVRVTPAGSRMLDEVDALSDHLLRSVLEQLDSTQLPGIARAVTALRTAVETTTGGVADHHPVSMPNPRSASTMQTMQGADPAQHHPRRD